jgi:hypothetical protein
MGIISITLIQNEKLYADFVNTKINVQKYASCINSSSDISQKCFMNNEKTCNEYPEPNLCENKSNICVPKNKTIINFNEFKKLIVDNYIYIYINENINTDNNYINSNPLGSNFYILYIIYVDNKNKDDINRKYIIVYKKDNDYFITYPTGKIINIPNNTSNYYKLSTRNKILNFIFTNIPVETVEKYIFCGHSEGCVMSQVALMDFQSDCFWTKFNYLKQKCYSVGSGMFQNVQLESTISKITSALSCKSTSNIISDVDDSKEYKIQNQELTNFNITYANRHLYTTIIDIDSKNILDIDPYFLNKDVLNNKKNLKTYISNFNNFILFDNKNNKITNKSISKLEDTGEYKHQFGSQFLYLYNPEIKKQNNFIELIKKSFIDVL